MPVESKTHACKVADELSAPALKTFWWPCKAFRMLKMHTYNHDPSYTNRCNATSTQLFSYNAFKLWKIKGLSYLTYYLKSKLNKWSNHPQFNFCMRWVYVVAVIYFAQKFLGARNFFSIFSIIERFNPAITSKIDQKWIDNETKMWH